MTTPISKNGCCEKCRPLGWGHPDFCPCHTSPVAEEKETKKPSDRIKEIYQELRDQDEKTGRLGLRGADAIIQYLDEIHGK